MKRGLLLAAIQGILGDLERDGVLMVRNAAPEILLNLDIGKGSIMNRSVLLFLPIFWTVTLTGCVGVLFDQQVRDLLICTNLTGVYEGWEELGVVYQRMELREDGSGSFSQSVSGMSEASFFDEIRWSLRDGKIEVVPEVPHCVWYATVKTYDKSSGLAVVLSLEEHGYDWKFDSSLVRATVFDFCRDASTRKPGGPRGSGTKAINKD